MEKKTANDLGPGFMHQGLYEVILLVGMPG